MGQWKGHGSLYQELWDPHLPAGGNGTVRGNSLVGREQEVRTRAPPTHQVQGKAEKILQLLLGEEALPLRTESVALRVGQPGIWGRVGTGGSQAGVGGGCVSQVRNRPGRGLQVETTSSGPGDCGIEDSGCNRGAWLRSQTGKPSRVRRRGSRPPPWHSVTVVGDRVARRNPTLTTFHSPDMPRRIKHVSWALAHG